MLVALSTIVALLIAVRRSRLGVLAVETQGQALAPCSAVATYQTLQTQAAQLRQLLSISAARSSERETRMSAARPGTSSAGQLESSRPGDSGGASQLGPAANTANLGFVPPKGDAARLDLIGWTTAASGAP